MNKWMLRGVVFGAAMVVERLIQGTLIYVWQTHSLLISAVLLAFFIAAVVMWGIRDGRADAAANPDPDRRADLAMVWLLAGLVAGVLDGAVIWLVGVFYKSLYVLGLVEELTTVAAAVALLVFVGGIIGVSIGRYLIDRRGEYNPQTGGRDEDRADTDVFAAVRSNEAASEGGEWTETQPGAVATAEREEHTETIPAHETAEHTEPAAKRDED
jgi:uncharacterized membrane protein YfcA